MLKTPTTPRHIRFAPLLDPRRAVVVTDDGHELPVKDDTHFPAATSLAVLRDKSQFQKQAATTCSDPLEHSSPGSPSSSSSFSAPTDLQTSSSSSPYSPRPQSRSFTVDILKPFKRPPSPSKKARKSKSLSFSTEEILTLGTINLFRSSTLSTTDQDSFKENNNPSSSHRNSLIGGGLSRRISSNPQTEKETLGNNLPLTRLSGAQEVTDRKKRRSSIAAFFSAAPGVSSLVEKTKNQRAKTRNTSSTASLVPSVSGASSPSSGSTITATRTPVLPPQQRTPRHKGARMLNGRIYGAKPINRISENPFANARDDEPEFVEWGYGGMGSVKGARSAGVAVGNNAGGAVNWERLLGGSEVSGQGAHSGWMVPGGGRGGAGARRRQEKEEPRKTDEAEKVGEDGEEDDGSGLAWIRKRRKMREEKEKKMKETEQAREKSPGSESTPTSPSAVATIKASVHDRDPGPGKAGPNGVDEHRHASSAQNVNGHHDHVMKAVSVPMRPKVPSHHKRTSSKGGVLEDEEAQNGATVTTTDHDVEKLEDVSQQESVERPAGSDSSSSSSSESSEEESDSDGEESSEEDQQGNEKRRTAIGAGVEKVTASFRHRGE